MSPFQRRNHDASWILSYDPLTEYMVARTFTRKSLSKSSKNPSFIFFLNPCASNSYSLISPWLLFFIPLCAYDSFPNVVISLQICCLNISLKSHDLFLSIWRDSLEHITKKTLQYLHLSFPFRVVAMYPWILSSQFMQ